MRWRPTWERLPLVVSGYVYRRATDPTDKVKSSAFLRRKIFLKTRLTPFDGRTIIGSIHEVSVDSRGVAIVATLDRESSTREDLIYHIRYGTKRDVVVPTEWCLTFNYNKYTDNSVLVSKVCSASIVMSGCCSDVNVFLPIPGVCESILPTRQYPSEWGNDRFSCWSYLMRGSFNEAVADYVKEQIKRNQYRTDQTRTKVGRNPKSLGVFVPCKLGRVAKKQKSITEYQTCTSTFGENPYITTLISRIEWVQ